MYNKSRGPYTDSLIQCIFLLERGGGGGGNRRQKFTFSLGMSTSLSRIVLQWKSKSNVVLIRLLLILYVQGLLSPILSIFLNSQKRIWKINVKILKSFRQDYRKMYFLP